MSTSNEEKSPGTGTGVEKRGAVYPGELQIFAKVADKLEKWQLFIFACVFMIFILCLRAGFAADRQNDNVVYATIGALVISLAIAAFIVVTDMKTGKAEHRQQTGQQRTSTSRSNDDAFRQLSDSAPEISEHLSAINEYLVKALAVKAPVFRNEMFRNIGYFRQQAKDWSEHQIIVSGATYNDALIDLYATAKVSVFSTSLPEYLPTWMSPLGESLLEAHDKSDATVVRIFLYEKFSSVSEDDYQVMRKISEFVSARRTKMSLYVWINEWDAATEFPPLLSKDFTIIDNGVAIGITQSLGSNNLAARWVFDDKNQSEICLKLADKLRKRAKEFSDFAAYWDAHPELRCSREDHH